MTPEAKILAPKDCDERLNVVILCDHGWINGGQAKIAIDSALSLRRRGLDICYIAGCGPLDERLRRSGIECHVVGDHDILSDPNRARAAASGIWNREAARVVAKAIAARDPRSTVIHVHGWAKALSPSIGPVVTAAEAAHVVTLHEYFLACPNGGFYDYQAGAICTRRALGADCLTTNCDARSANHKAWRVARQLVLKSAGRMPRDLCEIIYLAPKQQAIMQPYFSGQARWHYLPNPVGPAPDRRVAAETNDLFLFVGRLSPEKGAETAAAAAKLANVPIAFVGDGECESAIRRANRDAILAGWVEPGELHRWIDRARCLVFPSLWYETFGLVVADALRVGLPVLVADSSVAASLVADRVNGRHLPAGDVPAWAAAMSALNDDALVRRWSEAAFNAGSDLLDEDEYTNRLIGIYENVRSRRHGADARTRGTVQC